MWAIALVTLRRFQEPAFAILLVIGAIVAYATSGIDAIEIGFLSQADLATVDEAPQGLMMGTLVIGMLGALVGIFTGATEIPRDISSRMIAVLLSKPVSRGRYFVGKYLGCLMMALAFTGIWLTIMLCTRVFVGGESLSVGQALMQGRCLVMLVPIVGIAVAVSTYLEDIAAMVITFGLVFMGFAASLLPLIVGLAPPTIGKILLIGYFFIPNMGFFLAGPIGVSGEISLMVYAMAVAWLFLGLGRMRIGQDDIF